MEERRGGVVWLLSARVLTFFSLLSHSAPLSSPAAGALYTYLNVEYESKCPDTDVADIATLIGSKLRGGFTTDFEDFRQVSLQPESAFDICPTARCPV